MIPTWHQANHQEPKQKQLNKQQTSYWNIIKIWKSKWIRWKPCYMIMFMYVSVYVWGVWVRGCVGMCGGKYVRGYVCGEMCVYIYIYIYICVCVCVCVCFSLSLSLSLYIYIYIYICVCVCVCFSLSLSISLCVCVSDVSTCTVYP